jgi:3-oxoacyl-[acyl-carrier protein] reductase
MTPTLKSDLLANRRALVTGGAQGIGRAVAETLVANGARVCIADVDAARAHEAADALGGAVSVWTGDLLAAEAPDRLVDSVVSELGGLDILVNNAGYSWDAPVARMTDEQMQAMLDIHLVVPFRLCRAAAPHLCHGDAMATPYRKVVNVASLAHSFGNPGAANYVSAKAGVIGLTRSLANEWGRFGVTVNAVAFGFMQTRLSEVSSAGHTIAVGGRTLPLGVPAKALTALGVEAPEFTPRQPDVPEASRRVPGAALGRAGTAQEGADAIFFLSSPLSDYVTGQVLTVSGGLRGALS